MKHLELYILNPIPCNNDAWEPWYDKAFGFVVEAHSSKEARLVADSDGGDENADGTNPWLDPEQSTCERLYPSEGEHVSAAIIMRNFASA